MKNFWQFMKFCIVGFINTFISEVVYALVVCLHGHYIFANILGFVISVLNAYYWSNRYVFKQQEGEEKRVWWKVLLKTYMAYALGFVVNLLLLTMWVELVDISRFMLPVTELLAGWSITYFDADMLGELLAQALCLPVTIPLNFLMNKYWAYRGKKKNGTEE